MSEYIVELDSKHSVALRLAFFEEMRGGDFVHGEIVRCRDCKHLDIPDWDNTLAENYGEPPMFCMQLSMNEWRMDGDRRVADTTFLEVEPDGFCKWGERK